MPQKDKLTMTVEDEVVFLTDPNIEFVSLVKHGANQTPFKVLKSQNKQFGIIEWEDLSPMPPKPKNFGIGKGGPGSGPQEGQDRPDQDTEWIKNAGFIQTDKSNTATSNELIVFHGTNGAALHSILEKGILPGGSGKRNHSADYYKKERGNDVFVTSGTLSGYMAFQWAMESKITPDVKSHYLVIFAIDPKGLKLKEDKLGGGQRVSGGVPAKHIVGYDVWEAKDSVMDEASYKQLASFIRKDSDGYVYLPVIFYKDDSSDESSAKGGPGSGPREGDPRLSDKKVDIVILDGKNVDTYSAIVSKTASEINSEWGKTPDNKIPTDLDWDRMFIGSEAANELAQGNEGVILRDADGTSKGIASLETKITKTKRVMYVDYLATKESGYGRKVMAEVARLAAQKDCELHLASLPEAAGFYRKLGMKEDFGIDSYFRFNADQVKQFAASNKDIKEIQDDREPENGAFCVPLDKLSEYIKKKESTMLNKKGGPGSGPREGQTRGGSSGGSVSSSDIINKVNNELTSAGIKIDPKLTEVDIDDSGAPEEIIMHVTYGRDGDLDNSGFEMHSTAFEGETPSVEFVRDPYDPQSDDDPWDGPDNYDMQDKVAIYLAENYFKIDTITGDLDWEKSKKSGSGSGPSEGDPRLRGEDSNAEKGGPGSGPREGQTRPSRAGGLRGGNSQISSETASYAQKYGAALSGGEGNLSPLETSLSHAATKNLMDNFSNMNVGVADAVMSTDPNDTFCIVKEGVVLSHIKWVSPTQGSYVSVVGAVLYKEKDGKVSRNIHIGGDGPLRVKAKAIENKHDDYLNNILNVFTTGSIPRDGAVRLSSKDPMTMSAHILYPDVERYATDGDIRTGKSLHQSEKGGPSSGNADFEIINKENKELVYSLEKGSNSKKGDNTMEKVLQAILVPKTLGKSVKAIKGYRTDECKEYETYKSYIQVDMKEINPDSIEVITIDKEKMIMGVVGSLLNAGEEIVIGNVEKSVVDYTTMDDLYMQLYAMSDIVSGALRQDSDDMEAKANTILSAIDNFKTYSSMVLDALKCNTSDAKSRPEGAKCVNPENFPELAFPLIRSTKNDKEDNVNQEKIDALKEEIRGEFKSVLDGLKNVTAADVQSALETSMKALKDEIGASIGALEEKVGALAESHAKSAEAVTALGSRIEPIEGYVTGLKTSLKTQKSYRREGVENSAKEAGVFAGLLFTKDKE